MSDFSNSVIMKKYGISPDAESLDIVTTASRQKEIIVLLKIYWGDAREKLCESVDNIPLDSLVIGNRGLGKIQRYVHYIRIYACICMLMLRIIINLIRINCRVIMGSVSNYVVNNAPCPVTVVKSSD